MPQNIKQKIRTVPDWPKKGIMFRDITTLLQDGAGFHRMLDLFTKHYQTMKIDKVAGVEARGFIIGAALADRLGLGFVPIRKKGKLPAAVISQEYDLEYGSDKIEMHLDALLPGEKVLMVDDLIATGGTAVAACALIEKAGAEVAECAFVVDLPDLGGSKKLSTQGYKIFSLLEFEGE